MRRLLSDWPRRVPRAPRAQYRSTEQHAIGSSKVSIQITRKTSGDLVVSNFAIERYFRDEAAAAQAIQEIVGVIAHAPVEPAPVEPNDGSSGSSS